MTHPSDDLLTPYVDGNLPERERASVAAHLSTCARCTKDVADATAARSALRAIDEAAIPADVVIPSADPAAVAVAARRRADAPAWQRWAGPAAATAAIALVVTLVLPRLGGGTNSDLGSESGANSAADRSGVQVDAAPVPLELQSVDYDPESVNQLALQTAARLGAGAAASAPEGSASGTTVPKAGSASAANEAVACLRTAFRTVPGILVRLIRADFQGEPAYVGLYAEGPGAGQPADSLTVRVASAEGCAPLSVGGVPL